MEGVETVDVSWLHHSHKDNNLSRCRSVSSLSCDKPGHNVETTTLQHSNSDKAPSPRRSSSARHETSTSPVSPKSDAHSAGSRSEKESKNGDLAASNGTPPASEPFPKSAPKPVIGRRGSWISSISSKFSSGSTPPSQSNIKAQAAPKASPPASKLDLHNPFGAAYSPKDKEEERKDENSPFTSSSPRGPSFLTSALRKLSSSGSGGGKPAPCNGTICERRTLNIDKNRDRCKVPDLNPAKLRRVAFCVDVEIAGIAPRESDEEYPPLSTTRHHVVETNGPKLKRSNSKTKTKDESDPQKRPQNTHSTPVEKPAPVNENGVPQSSPPSTPSSDFKLNGETKEPTRKQEKKKRSEEERRERRERKRRLAEANGSIPLQLTADDNEDDSKTATPGNTRPGAQSHPTTDPIRIYRRCCQLRETPVLKRIVDEISSPSSTLAESPGTVAVLDLTNFPMTSEDVATFCDWLAVVPVRKLILEKCALTDDSVRAILSGLLCTKTVEQMRRRRGKKKMVDIRATEKIERSSVVEKLSLKDNPKIGAEGWRHISLFIHLSKSLKAIDLTGIPLPRGKITPNGSTNLPTHPTPTSTTVDVATVFSNSLSKRFGGDHLEELLLNDCEPTMDDVKKICEAATAVGLRRLGLANNGLTRGGLEHIVRYLESGKCEGLDLGGNPIGEDLDLITDAINSDLPVYALSLADCSLTPSTIYPLLQTLTQLCDLRFIDVSHNPALFSTQPDALSTFRRFLPKMPLLKRIHLADVNLSSDHTIALAEILPECPSLSHLNILENPAIIALASATNPETQEEACAVYASLLAAVRVSRTIIAVDIEDPSAENNEVVKALASQIVAHCLHNLEGGALEAELMDPSLPRTAVPIPEILQHIVGHGVADEGAEEDDDPAPDEDYVIGGTGVVKALGVCLGNLDRHMPGEVSGSPSGTTTPRHRKSRSLAAKRPRDMSKNLLDSARNIRTRIETALVREDRAGNDANYRRLQFLDFTLQKMIQRFEDEYPETRIIPQAVKPNQETSSQNSGDDGYLATSFGNVQSAGIPGDNDNAVDDDEVDHYDLRLSRASSITSLHSRAMTSEEGHVHRLGQNIRRDFLNPLDQNEEGESQEIVDESHIAALRERLDRLHDEQTRSRFDSVEADKAFQELGSTVEELWAIQRQDSEAFEKFKQSQIAAQINSGRRTPSVSDNSKSRASNAGREQPSA
ncbi:hypothetical protein BDV12DRAFT_159564 [Aspergillus spectabilis]